MNLSGWGNYPVVDAQELAPRDIGQAATCISSMTDSGAIIPRGLGRSYGDSSLATTVLSTRYLDSLLEFDSDSGIVRCYAGVSLSTLLEVFVPKGWFPLVTPGTKFITVGGAIASDVHGKNHHKDGSFCDHVIEIKVATVENGIVTCSPHTNANLFHATAGGMGLTGLIVEATFRLRPIGSSSINETSIRTRNLWETLDVFEEQHNADYSVAWIDCLSTGTSLGRSIVSLGEHVDEGELQTSERLSLPVPFDFPDLVLNRHSIKVFNSLHYRMAGKQPKVRQRNYDNYFYPLDSIKNWNRMYGRAGFVQYQFALPMEAGREGLEEITKKIAQSGKGSFLAVLKVLGNGNSNFLSFPIRGYTLALDFKVDASVFRLLDELDRIVLAYKGRIYLTKDARMSAKTFRECYPEWENFLDVRKQCGAHRLFHSGQSARLEL